MKPLIFSACLLLALTAIGTIGLRVIEHAPWLDCLFMAVITLTTVGYGEAVPLSEAGRLFVIGFLMVSATVFAYSAFSIGQWVVSAQIGAYWGKRRMDKNVSKLDGHFIICGLGRMGLTICRYLAQRQRPFVVIDRDDALLREHCDAAGWLYLLGDATDDDVLRRAGIQKARALTTVLSTDADNVYVVLTARMLNSQLQIIARASDDKAVQKMQHAGATRVVSPFSTGAVKMARFMLHPSIEDFLEVTDQTGTDLELADVQISPDSPYVGRKINETNLRAKGIMILGVRRVSGERLVPPPGDTILNAGDSLFAFGSAAAVNEMINATDSSRM